MARKRNDGDVNKSEAIRLLLKEKPRIKAKEAVTELGEKGISITTGLFYFIKGKVKGRKGRAQKQERAAANVVGANGDVLSTVRKVKALADEVGGMKKLQALIEVFTQ